MADQQEALESNPEGYSNEVDAVGGEERGVWGGQGPRRQQGPYTGGWSWHEIDGSRYQAPNDRDAYLKSISWAPSARQQDVDRYRGMGQDVANTLSPTIRYGAANDAFQNASNSIGTAGAYLGDAAWTYDRGLQAVDLGLQDRARANQIRNEQNTALGLQYGAATGAAPSRAEILGRGLIDQSLQSQLAGAAGARGGPLAQIAAQRQVQQQAAGFQQQGLNQLSALRADEMERARGQYMSGATGIRGQDYQGVGTAAQLGQAYGGMAGGITNIGAQHLGAAGLHSDMGRSQAGMAQAQSNLDMQQRQLNQAGQMDYEQLAWNTNKAAMDASIQRSGQDMTNYWNSRSADMQEQQMDRQFAASIAGTVGDTMGTTMNMAGRSGGGGNPNNPYSDMRAKTPAKLQYGSTPTTTRQMAPGKQPPLLLDLAGRQPTAANPNWLDQYMGAHDAKRARVEHDRRMEDIVEAPREVDANIPNIEREDPYITTPGDIQREDPYGSGEMYFSDEAAKREAFTEGVQHGWQAMKPPAERTMKLPSYMQNKKAPPVNMQQAGATPAPKPVSQPEQLSQRSPRQLSRPGGDRHLTITGYHGTAQQIDPAAHGEKAPTPARAQQYPSEVGGRPFERGRASDVSTPPKKDRGPLAGMLQDANRRQAGFPYAYRDEYTPPEQSPGEVNYGFSAQELAQNPVTATAVKPDPNGMLTIDPHKLQKVQSASIASLQDQIDELKGLRYG